MTKSPEIFQSRTVPEKNDQNIFFSSIIYGQSSTEYGYGQDGKMPLSSAFFPGQRFTAGSFCFRSLQFFCNGEGEGERKRERANSFCPPCMPREEKAVFSALESQFFTLPFEPRTCLRNEKASLSPPCCSSYYIYYIFFFPGRLVTHFRTFFCRQQTTVLFCEL